MLKNHYEHYFCFSRYDSENIRNEMNGEIKDSDPKLQLTAVYTVCLLKNTKCFYVDVFAPGAKFPSCEGKCGSALIGNLLNRVCLQLDDKLENWKWFSVCDFGRRCVMAIHDRTPSTKELENAINEERKQLQLNVL